MMVSRIMNAIFYVSGFGVLAAVLSGTDSTLLFAAVVALATTSAAMVANRRAE